MNETTHVVRVLASQLLAVRQPQLQQAAQAPLVPVDLRKLQNELGVNDALNLVAHTDIAQISRHAHACGTSVGLDLRFFFWRTRHLQPDRARLVLVFVHGVKTSLMSTVADQASLSKTPVECEARIRESELGPLACEWAQFTCLAPVFCKKLPKQPSKYSRNKCEQREDLIGLIVF
jgi:hypothetical protein